LAEDAKPNILFIALDDLNHWVGYLGRKQATSTPNIDRFGPAGRSIHSQLLCGARFVTRRGRP